MKYITNIDRNKINDKTKLYKEWKKIRLLYPNISYNFYHIIWKAIKMSYRLGQERINNCK